MTFANLGMRPDYLSQYRYSGSQSPSSVYQPIQSVAGLQSAGPSDLQEVIGGLSMANTANSAIKGLTGFNPASATTDQIKKLLADNPSMAQAVTGAPTYNATYTAADSLALPDGIFDSAASSGAFDGVSGGMDWVANTPGNEAVDYLSSLGYEGMGEGIDLSSMASDSATLADSLPGFGSMLSIGSGLIDGSGYGWDDTGRIVGSYFGPIGTMIGGAIGEPVGDIVEGVGGVVNDAVKGVGDIISGDGTVICTELHHQGLMSDAIYKADVTYGRLQDCDLIAGYHLWAKPLVKMMQKSPIITSMVRVLADPWSKEMAFRMGVLPNGNVVGKIIMVLGYPVCRVLGKIIQPKQQLVGV